MPTPSLQHHYNALITTTGRSAAIAPPQPFGVCFPLSVLQSDNDFTCSDAEPDLMSCQLNPGSGTASNPVSAVLCFGCKRTHPIFTPLMPYRGFVIGSLSFSSFRSQLRDSSFPFLRINGLFFLVFVITLRSVPHRSAHTCFHGTHHEAF